MQSPYVLSVNPLIVIDLNCEPEKCGDVRFFPKDELPGKSPG